jgi:hypothetical protein
LSVQNPPGQDFQGEKARTGPGQDSQDRPSRKILAYCEKVFIARNQLINMPVCSVFAAETVIQNWEILTS